MKMPSSRRVLLIFFSLFSGLAGVSATAAVDRSVERPGGCQKFRSSHDYWACQSTLLEPAERAKKAFDDFRLFQITEQDLGESAASAPPAANWVPRSRFSDEDLDVLLRLQEDFRRELILAESNLTVALDDYFGREAWPVDELTKILLLTKGDWRGATTLERLQRAAGLTENEWLSPDDYPAELLHPYGIFYAIRRPPRDEYETVNLPKRLNDLLLDVKTERFLLGSKDNRKSAINKYKAIRDQDNPGLDRGEHWPAPADTAFIDSGIDYRMDPKYAAGLRLNLQGSFGSYDFADGDADPWAPFTSALFHGTAVVDSYLAVLNRLSGTQGISTAFSMWKVFSVRVFLSGILDQGQGQLARLGVGDNRHWESRPLSYVDAIVRGLQEHGTKRLLLNMSMANIPIYESLGAESRQRLLAANWLWLMAAGNQRTQLREGDTSCLLDFPEGERPHDKILCVGVLEDDGQSIQKLSNYGPWVDLYTQQSFSQYCTGLTSCGTPGVTGLAAALAHRFPEASPSELKTFILSHTEPKEVQQSDGQRVTIRFLDLPKLFDQNMKWAAR